jgi:hypothetical protein
MPLPEVKDDFAVHGRLELTASGGTLGAKFGVIIDLAIEDH